MPKWIKIVLGLTITAIVVFAAGGYFLHRMLLESLPEYSGVFGGNRLKNDVEIYFDSLAVPYIIASAEEDAAYALGYLHARERMFQMDIARRAGEGRLSEVFGTQTVPFDKMFRTVGISKTAAENLKAANPATKKLLNAYSNGVNYYLLSERNNLPIEFSILGYEPYEWTPIHSLIVVRMIAWELNISWWTDIAFANLVQKVGEKKAMELLPDYPENAPTIIPPELKNYPKLRASLIEVDREFRKFLGFNGTHIGSNSWVVNGDKSVSGKPVIANDPHHAFQAPGKWYAAVIRADSWNVEGVTLPGVPAVTIGKNANISWGLTNIMADDTDFYIEQIDSSGSNYKLNGQWKKLIQVKDTIKVKDGADEVLEILYTHRGPIVSGVHLYKELYANGYDKNLYISMRWSGNDASDEFFAFYSLNKASNWSEFRNAVKQFSVPAQNFIYADKSGNTGYSFGGRLPVRQNVNPTFIYDGTTDKFDWKGFVPFDELPVLYNPQQNFIASANNKTVKDFKYHITNLWEPSSRIERITELLNGKGKHSVNDFQKYQLDLVSPYAKEITNYLLDAFKGIKITDKNLNNALRLFDTWDYKLDAYSQTASIYAVFLNKLLKNIFLDDLGYDLYNEFCFVPNVPYRTLLKLLKKERSMLFDNIKTDRVETKNEIIRESLVDALTELENRFGTDLLKWQWGNLHRVRFKHFFSGENQFVDNIINIGPFGIGGDGTTLFNTEYMFSSYNGNLKSLRQEPYENTLGPSMRFIHDFNEPEKFYLVLTTGQSGQPLSPHYKNWTEYWLTGDYVVIHTDRNSIEQLKDKIVLTR
ncbi:MAG TPA: penicillin acylase family protein [Ignavibacteriaceae bacterium]|nr:penicillin acylase family protein [Ignavibacteriaceae bacterium]